MDNLTVENTETEESAVNSVVNIIRNLITLISWVAATFTIIMVINTYIAQQTVVSGESMYDTLEDGDRIVISKLEDVERYDVVVFKAADNFYCIKRVYGLPGDTIRITDDGTIYINDEEIDDMYGTETIEKPGIAEEGITLGENEYFLLGDNRNNSMDSRDERIGVVNGDNIIGTAYYRFYPFNKAGLVDNIE